MAEPTTLAKARTLVIALALAPIKIPRYLATEPTITGALLYILTRPAQGHALSDLRARILSLFRSTPYLSSKQISTVHARSYGLLNLEFTLPKVILALKALLAVGIVDRANKAMNALAMNNYQLELPGLGRVLGSGRGPKRAEWRWDGRTELVVITGGCSGFGYEMVRGFAGKAKIVVIDRSDLPKELEQRKFSKCSFLMARWRREAGCISRSFFWELQSLTWWSLHLVPEVYFYKCDLTDFDAITTTTSEIKTRLGNPTVLINNAGIGKFVPPIFPKAQILIYHLAGTGKTILETPPELTKAVFAVNLSSQCVLMREFVPGMLAARKGHVVGISSMAAFVSAPGLVDYCVTKVGVVALHEGLRNELLSRYENGHCIANTTVHPSWHATGIIKGFEKRLEEYGIKPDPPSNVADAVIDQVLAHRTGKIYMPRTAEAQAGTRQLPLWVQDWALGLWTPNPFKGRKQASAEATGIFG